MNPSNAADSEMEEPHQSEPGSPAPPGFGSEDDDVGVPSVGSPSQPRFDFDDDDDHGRSVLSELFGDDPLDSGDDLDPNTNIQTITDNTMDEDSPDAGAGKKKRKSKKDKKDKNRKDKKEKDKNRDKKEKKRRSKKRAEEDEEEEEEVIFEEDDGEEILDGEVLTKKRVKKRKRDHEEEKAAYDAAKKEVEEEAREKTKYEIIEDEMKADFASIAAQKIVKSRRRGKPVEKAATEYNDDVETLAERMIDAYSDDKRDNSAGRLAVAKLKLLPEVIAMLHRRNPNMDLQMDSNDIDRPIVNKSFLKACHSWLQPLPDGTLPSLKIREGILKNLHKLEVDSTVLIESQIGIAVHTLFKHKSELPANKKLCQALISKWSRPIFGLTSDYTALKSMEPPTPYARTDAGPPLKRMRSSSEGSTSIDSVLSGDVLRQNKDAESQPWYPRKFTGISDNIRRPTAPSKNDDDDDEDDKKMNESLTAKHLRDRMMSMKKAKSVGDVRAYSVSLNAIPRAHERK